MPCLVFAATVLSIAGGDHMLTRYAIFEGRVRPGMDSEMRDYVNNVLAPLWRQFDGARTVRVMFGVEQDPVGPSFPLVLAITYLDAAAMARGLASPARYKSRDLLPEFFAKYVAVSYTHLTLPTIYSV